MKKYLLVLIVVVLSLSLMSVAGCGSSSDSTTSGSNTGASTPSSSSSSGNTIVGSWKDNADANTTMIYTADGKVTVNGNNAGTYAYSGSELKMTGVDGTVTTYEVAFDGNNVKLTDKAKNQTLSLSKSS